MKDKFYPSISNFLKIVRTISGVILPQDFAAPSPQNEGFDLQTGQPIVTNEKRPKNLCERSVYLQEVKSSSVYRWLDPDLLTGYAIKRDTD